MARANRKRDRDEEESDQDQVIESGNAVAWEIIYPKPPTANSGDRVRKAWDGAKEHESPFHGKGQAKEALNLRYSIKPHAAWNEMRHYTKFVIEKEDYGKLDYVYVRPPGLKTGNKPDEKKFWVARILEVRAEDAQHVYALIAWMYWPEQLDAAHVGRETPRSGRRSYHGKHELIASNHLDVMDVTTFAGQALVEHWLEKDDNDVQEGLYWRQTYNIKTGSLSDLRKHCICNKYYNPDSVMIACPNKDCHIWMHEECIIHDVLTNAYDRITNNEGKQKKKGVKRASGGKLAHELDYGQDQPYSKHFSAKIVDNGNLIQITDLSNNKVLTEHIQCLKCDVKLE